MICRKHETHRGTYGWAADGEGELCLEGHHCEHGVMLGPDLPDSECCLCGSNPCGSVTVEAAVRHADVERHRRDVIWEHEIQYVLTHGKRQEPPF